MLIEQLDGKQENAPYPTNLWGVANPNGQNNNSPFRQQFQSNLNANGLSGSNGYPQNLRKIALINGTTNGARTNNSGNKFLELAAFKTVKYGQIFGTPIQTKIKVVTINDSFLQNTGGYGQTFSGKVTIPRVGGIEVQSGSISRTNANPRGTMDVVQGGTFDTQGIIKDQFTLELNSEVDSQEWRTYLKNHAFIPSVSALAFKNPNFDWSTALNRNLVCDPNNKEIYFDSYFAPSSNEEHVLVTSENANWLIKELQGIQQVPSFPIDQNALVGSPTICLNSNTTYSFADVCKVPSAVTWSVTPNLQIISSPGYSVIVKGLTSGSGTITATFQNGQTIIKTMWVGLPSVPQLLTYSNIPYDSTLMNGPYWNPVWQFKTTNPNDLVEEFIFKDLSDNVIISKYPNGGTVEISASELGLGYGATLSFYVYTRNACGVINPARKSLIKSTIYYPTLCQYGIGQGCGVQRTANPTPTSYYKIFPNPSSNIINISLFDETITPSPQTLITAVLYDLKGQEKRRVTVVNNTASINVSNLKSGIYVLKIIIDGVPESHQVAVE